MLVLLTVEPEGDGPGDRLSGPDAYELSSVPLDGGTSTALMRISGLQDFGVGGFQLADATVDELRVVAPAEVDRGPLPRPLRGGAAVFTGLVAWRLTRRAESRNRRRSGALEDDGSAPTLVGVSPARG